MISPHLPQDPLERARLLSRLARGLEEVRGLTPEEFEGLRARGGLWYLEGALEL